MSRNSSFYAETRRDDAARIEAIVQAGLDIKTHWATAEPYTDSAGDFTAVDIQTRDDFDIDSLVSKLRAKVEDAGFKTYSEDEFDKLAS